MVYLASLEDLTVKVTGASSAGESSAMVAIDASGQESGREWVREWIRILSSMLGSCRFRLPQKPNDLSKVYDCEA